MMDTPYNAISGKAYSGKNTGNLLGTILSNGYTSGAFLTYKQAQSLGFQVRKGEKGTAIVKVTPRKKEALQDGSGFKKGTTLRRFVVFNIAQMDNVDAAKIPPAPYFLPDADEGSAMAVDDEGDESDEEY